MSKKKCQLFGTFSKKVLQEYAFSWKFILLNCVVIPLALMWINLSMFQNETRSPEIINNNIDQELLNSYFPENIDDKLLYFPDNNFTENLMEGVRLQLELGYESVGGFKNEADLEKVINSTTNKNLFLVTFHKIPDGRENILKFSIRKRNFNSRKIDEYLSSALLALYTTINIVYMEQRQSTSLPITDFPANPLRMIGATGIPSFAALLIIILCVNVVISILIRMVLEKENGIRALLKITTRNFYLYDIARIVTIVIFLFILLIIVFGITQYYQMWGEIHFYYPLLLTLLFVLALLSYTIFISLFFKAEKFCKLVGICFYIIPFPLFLILSKTWYISIFRHFSPANMFFEGMELINMHVLTCKSTDLCSDHQTTLFYLFKFYFWLLLHTVLYLWIYLFSNDTERKISTTTDKLMSVYSKNSTKELGHQHKTTLISLQCVSKNFYSCTNVIEAVKNVSMDVPSKGITVLLGHMGAGKTTLMSIIAGASKASKGIVLVNNQTVDDYEYLEMIGYCPQRNVSMKQFNCLEHVKFFGELRGLSPSESAVESKKVLNDVKLWSHVNKYPNELSEGMKRRLSLAMSVIGNTKIVIMDEPSSGLDAIERKELWEILLKLKENRAILLSTLSAEEAYFLGDKVAIMKKGQIVFDGPSLKLTTEYTSGNNLKIVTNPLFNESEMICLLKDEATHKKPMTSNRFHGETDQSVIIPMMDDVGRGATVI